MTTIHIPEHIADALPTDCVRAALATLGLVLDGHFGPERTLTARWASEAVHDQRCSDPGCPRLPAVIVGGRPYCGTHGRRLTMEQCQS